MSLEDAAKAIQEASHLLISAGAGMGVDSGLPDFRGQEGFWNAYPPYRKLGLSFVEMASPDTFHVDPTLAWGFYGHRLHLYRDTEPHEGFRILLRWAASKKSSFVFTSNVDGHFQMSGFGEDRIYEVHGSIHHLQCLSPCAHAVWPADNLNVPIDRDTMRAEEPLPKCLDCGDLARPNILLFGDFSYLPTRQEGQARRYRSWLADVGFDPVAIVEMGAGVAVPTVRYQSEQLCRAKKARLVRINPRDPEVPAGEISLPMGALEGVRQIDAILTSGF